MAPDVYSISSVTSGNDLATSAGLRDWYERLGLEIYNLIISSYGELVSYRHFKCARSKQ